MVEAKRCGDSSVSGGGGGVDDLYHNIWLEALRRRREIHLRRDRATRVPVAAAAVALS